MICHPCGEQIQGAPCTACGQEPRLQGRYCLDGVLGRGSSGTTLEASAVDDAERVPVTPEFLGSLPTYGDPEAPVRIVTFTNLECKFCAKSSEILAEIATDRSDVAPIGVRGTPHPFVEGLSVSGAKPRGTFEEAIGQTLSPPRASSDPDPL